MKRVAILGLVVTCLALAGMALRSTAPAVAQAEESEPQPPYVVEPATLAGVGYQLTGLAWHIDAPGGHANGGRYRLLCPGGAPSPLATGSGCCCTYLPVVTGSFHSGSARRQGNDDGIRPGP